MPLPFAGIFNAFIYSLHSLLLGYASDMSRSELFGNGHVMDWTAMCKRHNWPLLSGAGRRRDQPQNVKTISGSVRAGALSSTLASMCALVSDGVFDIFR